MVTTDASVFKLARIAHHLNTYEFAALSKLSRPTIQRIEEGRGVHQASVEKYIDTLMRLNPEN